MGPLNQSRNTAGHGVAQVLQDIMTSSKVLPDWQNPVTSLFLAATSCFKIVHKFSIIFISGLWGAHDRRVTSGWGIWSENFRFRHFNLNWCVTLYIYSCSGPSDVARVFSGVGSEKLSGFFGAKTKTPGVLRRADIAKIFDEINKNYICSMKRQNALYQMHLILYNIIHEEITDNKLIYTYLFCLWQNLPIRSINLWEANIPFLIFLVDYCQALCPFWSLIFENGRLSSGKIYFYSTFFLQYFL